MSVCTCHTDPLFYWVWVDPKYGNAIERMCEHCITLCHHGAGSIDSICEYYGSGLTRAFESLEEAELYKIKQRL